MPFIPAEYERFKNEIVWRVIAAHRRYGHWEYIFDDYVLTCNLGDYLYTMNDRGAERITLKKLGPFSNVILNDREHLSNISSLAHEKKNMKLEAFT